jgi:hypothetical protein
MSTFESAMMVLETRVELRSVGKFLSKVPFRDDVDLIRSRYICVIYIMCIDIDSETIIVYLNTTSIWGSLTIASFLFILA